MAYLRKNMAIDLGTTSVLCFTRSQGVVLNEPSVVAFDSFSNEIVAVGAEAKRMLGKTPGNIIARRPLKDGVIADYPSTAKMLDYFIHKAMGRSLLSPDVVICVPSEATQVQKRAVVQAAKAAGVHSVYLIEEALAAAIGSGVDISEPGGHMIVDIGGGTTDIAVISLGGIVVSRSIRVAGNAFDQAILRYIRDHYNLIIGDSSAEELKIQMGSGASDGMEETMEVKGRSLDDGLPKSIYISSTEMAEALRPSLMTIVDAVHDLLSNTPPELAADLYDRGILLTGGGSLIKGLDRLLHDRISIDLHHPDHALTAVVRGTGSSLNWLKKWNPSDELFSESTRQQIIQREELRRR